MTIQITKRQEIVDDVEGEYEMKIVDKYGDIFTFIRLTLPEARELLEELNKKLLKE